MSNGHAKLPPSAAERWLTCPGSVPLSEGMPERSSDNADEGTLAHKLAEKMLRREPLPKDADPDMVKYLKVYTDHVDEIYDSATSAVRKYEQKVEVTPDLWGSADAVVYVEDTKTLHVIDLKYGAGVMVEVNGNKQLKTYALASLLSLGFKAETVVITVVQPRIPHEDGPIRSKEFASIDLLDFHADLMEGIERVKFASIATAQGRKDQSWVDTYLQPSEKGCRWCLAAPTCPKLKQKGQELAKQVFAEGVAYDPAALSETLDFLDILEGWIKNTREFAYKEAEAGNPIPNYKLVPKKPTSNWRPDVQEELAKLLGLPASELLKPGALLPIGEVVAMAKALGKNDKERRAALQPFIVTASSGHTLVHDSDKRDAVRVDAKHAFAEAVDIFS